MSIVRRPFIGAVLDVAASISWFVGAVGSRAAQQIEPFVEAAKNTSHLYKCISRSRLFILGTIFRGGFKLSRHLEKRRCYKCFFKQWHEKSAPKILGSRHRLHGVSLDSSCGRQGNVTQHILCICRSQPCTLSQLVVAVSRFRAQAGFLLIAGRVWLQSLYMAARVELNALLPAISRATVSRNVRLPCMPFYIKIALAAIRH